MASSCLWGSSQYAYLLCSASRNNGRFLSNQNEINLMQPNEIGHAAAYEAYRTWIHNSSIHEPLSGDIERQREALTGLAVAEGPLLGSS